jgi:hypothetical protein
VHRGFSGHDSGKEFAMSANPAHMFFCGSIPLEHEVDVFKTLAEIGGERLRRVPDGELGDRKMWVIGQYAVLAAAAALDFGPFPAEGLTRRTCYQIPLRLRAGKTADDIAFSGLGYARHASSSYGLFREMKKAGKIPAHWRLQVNLPTPSDVMPMIEASSKAAAEKPTDRRCWRSLTKSNATSRMASSRSPGTSCTRS